MWYKLTLFFNHPQWILTMHVHVCTNFYHTHTHTHTHTHSISIPSFDNVQERIVWTKKQSEHKKEQRECYALWMDMLYRLSLANHVRSRGD